MESWLITIAPMLWRVRSYSGPGLPSPITIQLSFDLPNMKEGYDYFFSPSAPPSAGAAASPSAGAAASPSAAATGTTSSAAARTDR